MRPGIEGNGQCCISDAVKGAMAGILNKEFIWRHYMKLFYTVSIPLCIIFLPAFPTPIIYFSPGFHIEYDFKKSFSWGIKLSGGTCTDNGSIANATIGFSAGNFFEEYIETQFMHVVPIPIIAGGGLGLTHLHREDEVISAIRPRLSLFGGLFLFGNSIYVPMVPKELPSFRIGTTIVLPVPINPPSFSFSLGAE
jgi:hypothetical protein